jgi:hypothetical protein
MAIIKGVKVNRPERKPSLNIARMAEIVENVNAILNPGKEKIDWFAPDENAVAAVYIKDGKYIKDKSNANVKYDGTISDSKVMDLKVVSYDGTEGGIYVEGAASDVILDGAYISTLGDGMGIGGPASGAAVKYNGNLTVKNAIINTQGRTRYATAAEEGSVLKVHDSVLWAHGIPYGDDIKKPNALMSTPPPPLEIDGNTRCHCTMSNSSSYFYNSKIICDGWAALSTESSEGYVYLEANDCDIICTKSGYGAYSDPGCHDIFNRCNFEIANMAAIIAGNSDMTFNDCKVRCGSYFALSHNVNGWAEEVAELTVKGGNIKTVKETVLIKSNNIILNMKDVTISSEKGVFIQTIVNDDPCKTMPIDPYGVQVILTDMEIKGDIIHNDNEREMWLELSSTVVKGQMLNVNINFDKGSKWIATKDSKVKFISDVDLAQIDAFKGVTITAKGAVNCDYDLASGGKLIIVS